MADELVIHSAGDEHCVATWRNVLFTTWRGAVPIEPLSATRAISFALAAEYAEGVAVYNIIERGIPMPDTETRKLAAAIIHETGDHLRCTCTCVVAEGIWAGMARAALAGITLLARHRHPQKVFGDLSTGAQWVAPLVVPEGTSPTTLVAIAERLRHTSEPARLRA